VHQNVEADTLCSNVDGIVVVSIPKDGPVITVKEEEELVEEEEKRP
jgi:hypothetical protein